MRQRERDEALRSYVETLSRILDGDLLAIAGRWREVEALTRPLELEEADANAAEFEAVDTLVTRMLDRRTETWSTHVLHAVLNRWERATPEWADLRLIAAASVILPRDPLGAQILLEPAKEGVSLADWEALIWRGSAALDEYFETSERRFDLTGVTVKPNDLLELESGRIRERSIVSSRGWREVTAGELLITSRGYRIESVERTAAPLLWGGSAWPEEAGVVRNPPWGQNFRLRVPGVARGMSALFRALALSAEGREPAPASSQLPDPLPMPDDIRQAFVRAVASGWRVDAPIFWSVIMHLNPADERVQVRPMLEDRGFLQAMKSPPRLDAGRPSH